MTIIRVDGVPAPQGSKIRTRYGMREASKRVGPWREAVLILLSLGGTLLSATGIVIGWRRLRLCWRARAARQAGGQG